MLNLVKSFKEYGNMLLFSCPKIHPFHFTYYPYSAMIKLSIPILSKKVSTYDEYKKIKVFMRYNAMHKHDTITN